MKQRVREATFNLLGKRFVGAHVIDLFAGTGALTWEALSRGAASGTLVERHFPSARLIKANAANLGLTDHVTVVAGDTFFWARQLAPQTLAPEPDRAWLVFCCPPYELYVAQPEQMIELVDQLVQHAPWHSLIVVEADQRFDCDRLPDSVTWDVRTYPPAVIALAEKAPPG
jgi:16S rRNA (guanine966-N2)-methyltransferase